MSITAALPDEVIAGVLDHDPGEQTVTERRARRADGSWLDSNREPP